MASDGRLVHLFPDDNDHMLPDTHWRRPELMAGGINLELGVLFHKTLHPEDLAAGRIGVDFPNCLHQLILG